MIDEEALLEAIKMRLSSLEIKASKYRKGRDGHNLHKIKARKDELYRLRQLIQSGTYEVEEEEQ